MSVIVVTSGGGGDAATTQVEVRNPKFFIKLDGEELYPAVVTNLEIEHSGESSTITTDCGDTERRRTGNLGWVVTVEGICTSNDVRTDNLSMQKLRDVIAPSETVDIRSALLSGTIIVSNVVLSSPESATEIETERTAGRERAWAFRMTLGEEESDG